MFYTCSCFRFFCQFVNDNMSICDIDSMHFHLLLTLRPHVNVSKFKHYHSWKEFISKTDYVIHVHVLLFPPIQRVSQMAAMFDSLVECSFDVFVNKFLIKHFHRRKRPEWNNSLRQRNSVYVLGKSVEIF